MRARVPRLHPRFLSSPVGSSLLSTQLWLLPESARPWAAYYGSKVQWLPAGLREIDATENEKGPVLVEGSGPGRLMRVLHRLPGRRYRWAVLDGRGEEWRLSTSAVRFAMSGVTLPLDPLQEQIALSRLELGAARLVQAAREQHSITALWQSMVETGVTSPTPEDVRQWLRLHLVAPAGAKRGRQEQEEKEKDTLLCTASPPDGAAAEVPQPQEDAEELYAAHRLLNETYECFALVNGAYRTRTPAEREAIEREQLLFDLKSKQLLLFLLRLDKQRRTRREQRRHSKQRLATGISDLPSASSSSSSSSSSSLSSEEGAERRTHVDCLPSGFATDVNTVRSLFSATELQEAEWWDPQGRDAARVNCLQQYALTPDFGHPTSPAIRSAVLTPLGYRGSPGDAFSLLVELGIIDDFTNMHRLRATHLEVDKKKEEEEKKKANLFPTIKDPFQVSKKEEQEQEEKKGGDAQLLSPLQTLITSDRRTDVRFHTVYTIDDATTTEVDDGISVDLRTTDSNSSSNNNKYWVFVHIADPTSALSLDDPVDHEARRRVSTIYLPETTIPMMPPSVYRHFSLEPRRDNRALTFAFKINPEDGSIQDYEISSSVVSRVKKLTYEQVDAALARSDSSSSVTVRRASTGGSRQAATLSEDDHVSLRHLHTLAMLRKRWRLAQGAQTLTLPKPAIKVINTPHLKRVSVSVEHAQTPAHELVAEMMIAANQVAGMYACKHGLAVPYRHQAAPYDADQNIAAELEGLPEHIKAAEVVRLMRAAEISLAPARHTSLGLDTYVQVTSPIRRFVDMIAHRQIKAHLARRELPYTSDTLAHQYLPYAQQRLQHIKELVQQTNSFWILQNFMRTSRQKLWDALVVRIEEEPSDRYPAYLVQAHFLELGWSRPVRLLQRPRRGDILKLQLQYVSPYTDTVAFKPVGNH